MSIDPKTAATLAKFVIQIANDDEAALLIILAPLITVLLILVFIIYIVTSPLESIVGFFIGNELDLVRT